MANPKTKATRREPRSGWPAFLFDLDGTLIDSVYQHTLAWTEACERNGVSLPTWLIHRRIGMSGGLLVQALLAEAGRTIDPKRIKRFEEKHSRSFRGRLSEVRALPGARDLLSTLSSLKIRWAIATSGNRQDATQLLEKLGFGQIKTLITRDEVSLGKPAPDLFLKAARELRANLEDCVVVGDSVWDLLAARRARALGVGLLTGGFSEDELIKAGAYRVYQDPQDLLRHLDEIGIRESANR